MALTIITEIITLLVSLTLVEKMVNYIILSNKQKHIRYNNMKNRCGKKYQEKNIRYKGTYMWDGWLKYKKSTFFVWLDANFYVVENEQMDIDKDILQYGNKQYHPELCLIVPHSINSFYENIEVGKTSITYNSKTDKYTVKIFDMGENIVSDNISSYNKALDIYCAIKQGILMEKAKVLKSQIPEKVYLALVNTDIKAINQKYYENGDIVGRAQS